MKITKRQIKILRHLNDCGESELKQLCALVDVTPATMRTEIQTINELFEAEGVELLVNPGSIVSVEGAQNLPKILAEAESDAPFEPDDLIVLYAVVVGEYAPLQTIADALHVSKSFLEKRVAHLKKDATPRIVTEHRLGMKFAGTPYERAAAFTELMLPHVSGVDYLLELGEIENEGIPVFSGLSRKRIEAAVNFAKDLRKDNNESLTDDSYRQILLYATFLLSDDAPGAHDCAPYTTSLDVVRPESFDLDGSLVQLATLPEALQYRNRVTKAALDAHAEFSESQIRLLTGLMASVRKSRKLDIDVVAQDMDGFVLEMLAYVNEKLAVDLRADRALRQGLALHIYTTVVRRDNVAIVLDAYQEQEIKNRYPLGFEMASISASFINEHYNYMPTETEIVYLALHYQVAIERMMNEQRHMTAAVVCHYGQAAANLIAEKISRLYPLLDIKRILSMQDYLDCDEKFDIVLATERVPETDADVIYVTPALRANEIERVRTAVNDRAVDITIEKRIREADVIDISGCNTKEEAIRLLVDHLEAMSVAGPDFYDSVIERENLSSTNLNFIAVPHGNPEIIHESQLVIGRTRDGLEWGDSTINCVFLFACAIDLLKERATVFSKFYRRLATLDKQGTINDLKGIPAEMFRQQLVKIMTDSSEGRN